MAEEKCNKGINMKFGSAIFFVGSLLFLFSGPARADQDTTIRAGIANASISGGAFEDDDGFMGAIAHSLPPFDLLMGYMRFDEFKSERARNSFIEVSAWSLGAGKSYQLNPKIGAFGMLGMGFWDADATLLSTPAGSDSGKSLWYGAGFDFSGFKTIHLYGIFEHYDDVSGSDIQTLSLQLGMGF